MTRAVVLGLDGLSWPLARDLAQQGVMPHLADLMASSSAGPMNSTWPEISPVAWTTFFTASSPAEHGIYGFTDFVPGGYQVRLNSSRDVKKPYIWDWLDLAGKKSVVLNVPLTYPAWPVSGIMVSGFVALEEERAVHPRWVAQELRRLEYRLEADFEKVHQDPDVFLDELSEALAGRVRLFERFVTEPWDLLVLVVTDTDRLFHFFLREYEENGPITGYFLDFFRRVDELVGRVRGLVEDEPDHPRLVMLSDHGFAGTREEFHVNRWLAANGYQQEVGPGARILALDPTRLYFNTPGRFPGGRVTVAEARSMIPELVGRLLKEPAVDQVMEGRDLYRGPQAHLAPDLVIRPARGYEFKGKFTPGEIHTPSPLKGTHTYEDAFFLIHPQDESGSASIHDILDLGRWFNSEMGLASRNLSQP